MTRPISEVEARKAKAEYDRKYRARNKEWIAEKKAAYFQRTYDPKSAAVERKRRMPIHVEYCRRPRYVAWKKDYDRKRRAAQFGESKDAWAALLALKKEIAKQQPDRFERYAQAQRHQWNPVNQQRRRNGKLGISTDSL
jgi:hypothetical protein